MRLPRSRTALAAAGLLLVAPLVASGSAAAGPPSTSRTAARSLGGIDVEQSTIPDIQRAMDSGRLSSVRLTAYYLGQISRLNPKLHAVIHINKQALVEAALSDVRHHLHSTRGPMDGIPILLKDNVGTRDEPTTAGSEALAKARTGDAFLVSRLRAAGAVIIGKANLSEWANFRSSLSSSGWSGVGGQTNNPYVLDRNPCGSSSGSAVGVSAHLATVAIGTETDGSVVCPSGANGVVGIKPTLGLVSRSGVVPISAEQDTAGPIARNVTDAAVVLSVINGVDRTDQATEASRGHASSDYTRFLNPDALRGRRIGLWVDSTGGSSPETDAIFQRFAATLRDLGATPVEVSLPFQDVVGDNEFPALLNEFKHDINAYLATTGGQHPENLAGLIAFDNAHADTELRFFDQDIFDLAQATSGDLTDPTYLQQRHDATDAAQRSIDETMKTLHLDAIAAPTNSPAWKTTLGQGDTFLFGTSGPAAVAGYPNVSVPMGFVGPLPVGVSLFGGRWDEPRLISFAYAFEQATHVRTPPQFIPTIG